MASLQRKRRVVEVIRLTLTDIVVLGGCRLAQGWAICVRDDKDGRTETAAPVGETNQAIPAFIASKTLSPVRGLSRPGVATMIWGAGGRTDHLSG